LLELGVAWEMDAEERIKVLINPSTPDRDLRLHRNEQNFSRCLCRLNLDTPILLLKNFSKGHFPVTFFGVRHGDVETEGGIFNADNWDSCKGGKELVILSKQCLVF